MKIIALRNTLADGQHLEAGNTYDIADAIADAIAKTLIGMKKAEACTAEDAPQKTQKKKPKAKDAE